MTCNDQYLRVVQLYEKGEYGLEVGLARQYLQESPNEGRLWQVCGTACFHLKDFDSALEALEHASALIPLHPLAQFALATCYVFKDKSDLACVIYDYLAAISPATTLLTAIASRFGALGRYEAALQVCHKITELNPSRHPAFFGIAYYLNHLGNPPETLIAPLRKAIDLAPQIQPYRINLAFALSETGQHGQAYELLKPLPLAGVRRPCWLRRMRDIFETAGDQERSLDCYVRLASFPPYRERRSG